MKQLNGKITLSYRQNKDNYKHDLYIIVKDELSRLPVIEIMVSTENVSEIFSNVAEIPMSYDIYENSERLGKTVNHFSVTLPINATRNSSREDREAAATRIIKYWLAEQPNKDDLSPSYHFGSKNSFQTLPDGTQTVTFTVREYH
jgi:hypothetical protein